MDRTKAIVLTLLLLVGCSQKPRVVVGSKNFTEQLVLGEIVAQQIERRLGVAVERKLNLGGTLLAHEGLKSGAIDLYPEYTGTALTAVLKQPAASDPSTVFDQVRTAYAQQWQLEWLRPLGFNNTFAMVVRNDSGLKTLSQAATRPWRLGVGYEFLKRPDGLAGFQRAYNLPLAGTPVTMDLGLLYTALQTNKVDMVAANSTDGLLSVLPVVTLDDDKRYFPPYECALIVRQDKLREMPELRGVLEQLSGKLDQQTMRRLNHAVDGEKRSLAEVAKEFLASF